VAVCLGLFAAAGRTADLKNRSTSSSGQFIVYCDDRVVRSAVVSSIEEIKSDLLRILQESDRWDLPIVISIDRAETGKPVPPAVVQLTSTPTGPKVDIVVRVGDDPAKVFLQRHVLRALFLEMAYRDRVGLKPGERYNEPPWWLADGFIQTIRRREHGADTDLFKSIVNTEKLPEFGKFLTQPPILLDSPAGLVDEACAMCLVEALLALPNGAQNMGRFIRRSPDADGDMLGMLGAHFPELADSQRSLEKWWTLQIARFSGADRWQGMSIAETEKELSGLLTLELPVDKAGRTQKFELSDFASFVKLPAARMALSVVRVKIVALSAKASPLYRPILGEYEQLCGRLSVRKTKGVADRLAGLERYRTTIVQRMGQITDYINWYEATQAEGRTGAFNQFLRRADEINAKPPPAPVDPRITEYLNSLEKDFLPLFPDTIPTSPRNGAALR
jgi:hypothetical protein